MTVWTNRFRSLSAFGPACAVFVAVTSSSPLIAVLGRLPTASAQQAIDRALPRRSEDLESTVRRWVEALEAPQRAAREAAQRSLIDAGVDALAFLPEADEPSLSVEARQRLRHVREAIAAAEANAAASDPQGSEVRLTGATTLGQAITAIMADSGIDVRCDADPSLPITPHDGRLPFWHALDHVLDSVDLDVDRYSPAGTLRLVPRHQSRPSRVDSAAYAAVYRLEPILVTSRRVLHDSTRSGLSVELQLAWKPGRSPIGISLPLESLTARLDDGNTIQPPADAGQLDVSTGPDVHSLGLRVPLPLPEGRPTQITELAGRLRSMLPGRSHDFEFRLDAPNQTKSEQAVTVTVESLTKTAALSEVRLSVEVREAGTAMESHRGWLLDNVAIVRMSDGSERSHLGFQLYRQTQEGIGVGYLFDLGDSPETATLVYRTPTAVVREEVDFVIQDIPLP